MSPERKARYSHLGDIEHIVNSNLCTRCGACALCPSGAIRWEDSHLYPNIDRKKCTDCGICMAVCPGGGINIPQMAEQVFGESANVEHPLGTVIESFIAYAQDEAIRDAGAGGGVVTQLLVYLLDAGKIDGVLLVGADSDYPWRSKPVIATTVEQIKACAGSRYTVVPTLMAMSELRHHKGKRFALVGLPCQVHGYRLLERVMPSLPGQISMTIGLYCGANWEIEATTTLIARLGVALNDVARVEYRGGEWPGAFWVTTRGGEKRTFSKLIFNYLRFMYVPFRCTTCVDMANEFADLAIGDAWFKESDGTYSFANCSTVLVRTLRGLDAIRGAVQVGALGARPADFDIIVKQHKPGINSKKLLAYQRTNTRRGFLPNYGVPVRNLGFRERLGVVAYNLALQMAHFPPIRQIATTLLISPIGLSLMQNISWLREKLGLDLV